RSFREAMIPQIDPEVMRSFTEAMIPQIDPEVMRSFREAMIPQIDPQLTKRFWQAIEPHKSPDIAQAIRGAVLGTFEARPDENSGDQPTRDANGDKAAERTEETECNDDPPDTDA
uniref:hypothetical protein n=1 Tax=Mycobacterium sp. D16R24 TaxID=1855656 RepID=UPI001C379FF2